MGITYEDGAVYGGADGQPAKITHVSLVEGGKTEDQFVLEVWVNVQTRMLNDKDPAGGTEPIEPHDVMIRFGLDELINVESKDDLTEGNKARISVQQIARITKKPFKIDSNTLLLFAEGGQVYKDLLESNGFYIKSKDSGKPNIFYFNPFFYQEKKKPLSVKDLAAKLKARREG